MADNIRPRISWNKFLSSQELNINMKTVGEYQSVTQPFLLADVWCKDNAKDFCYHRMEKRW